MSKLNDLIMVAEDLGWSVKVTESENYICFNQYSPAGQDFNIEINYGEVEEIPEKVREYYEGYDVSYEAYLWLDSEGHGTNGAPYDMKDVYEDMEACESMMEQLVNALEDIDFDEYED